MKKPTKKEDNFYEAFNSLIKNEPIIYGNTPMGVPFTIKTIKKPTKKKLKKIEKKEIKKKLDEWKIKGKKKWGDKCEICGSDKVVQYHHFFPRKHYKELEFDVYNCVPLCRSCHFKLERTKQVDIGYRIIVGRGINWLKKLLNKI